MSRRRAAIATLLLLGSVVLAAAWHAARREPEPTLATISALRAERQRLQDRLAALTHDMRGLQLEDAPAGGVLIGIPTEFSRDLAQQLISGMFGRVTLRLRNLKLSKSDDVQARILFGQRTLGQFVLDVSIAEVAGQLRPRPTSVRFAKNQLGVSLKVALVEGRGTALLQLHWDSRGMASAICGDIDVSRELHAAVAPADYAIDGSFAIAADGGAILLKPRFAEHVWTVRVQPSEEAWRAIDDLVEQQGPLCRTALRKVDVKQRLRELIGRGFNVTLPPRLFRDIRLPLGVRQSLELQGITLTLQVRPVGVVVTPARIWYGADVTMERGGKG